MQVLKSVLTTQGGDKNLFYLTENQYKLTGAGQGAQGTGQGMGFSGSISKYQAPAPDT
jgi:hypothetical protein